MKEKQIRIAECRACLRKANAAYDTISGNRLKASGAYEVVEALEKRLKYLQKAK